MSSRGAGSLLFMLLVTVAASVAADTTANSEFPLRWRYPDVITLSADQLYKMQHEVLVVDARTKFKWETMRINGSINVPVDEVDTGMNRAFEDSLAKVRKSDARPIVFYCNGKTCPKSHEAARRIGLDHIYAYDAGIFDWAMAHPELTTLYDKSPIEASDLIDPVSPKTHTLSAEDFRALAYANPCHCISVDIRDLGQRDFLFFPMREEHVSLDDKTALNDLMEQAKQQKKKVIRAKRNQNRPG
ncbi:MAG: rhodanese-like domain-containing protein [Sulfuricaulis sp.]